MRTARSATRFRVPFCCWRAAATEGSVLLLAALLWQRRQAVRPPLSLNPHRPGRNGSMWERFVRALGRACSAAGRGRAPWPVSNTKCHADGDRPRRRIWQQSRFFWKPLGLKRSAKTANALFRLPPAWCMRRRVDRAESSPASAPGAAPAELFQLAEPDASPRPCVVRLVYREEEAKSRTHCLARLRVQLARPLPRSDSAMVAPPRFLRPHMLARGRTLPGLCAPAKNDSGWRAA